MALEEMDQLRVMMDENGARTAFVAGASSPPRPPETVTVAPDVSGTVGPGGRSGLLYVTAETTSGRTVRRYDGRDARAVADCAADLTAERRPRAVWLCERGQIRSWWGDGVTRLLERRLGDAARRADARLVVWSNEDEWSNESEDDVAVGDRYDVVVAP